MTVHDTFAHTEREPGPPQLNLDGITISFATTETEADALMKEIAADAGGGLIAIDLETAPGRAAVDRLRQTARCNCQLQGNSRRAAQSQGRSGPDRRAEGPASEGSGCPEIRRQGWPRPAPCRHPAAAALRRRQARCGDRSVPHRTGNPAAPQRPVASSPTMPAST